MPALFLLVAILAAAPDRAEAQDTRALRTLAEAGPGDWVSALSAGTSARGPTPAVAEPPSIVRARSALPSEASARGGTLPSEPSARGETLSSVTPAGADAPTRPGELDPVTPSDVQVGPSVVPDDLRPAEIVAARVRRVLGDGADREAWRDLAGALPELALSGEADPESTFTATRLAEEAVTGRDAPGAPTGAAAEPPASRSVASARVSWAGAPEGRPAPTFVDAPPPVGPVAGGGPSALETLDVELLGTLFALIAAGVVVWTTVRTQAPRVRPVSPPRAGTRLEQVRALAADGASEADIARRTGIPRDAVAVLMRVSAR